MKRFLISALFVAMTLGLDNLPAAAATASRTLKWNAVTTDINGNTDPNISGYRVFMSTLSFQRSGVWISTTAAMSDPTITQNTVASSTTSYLTTFNTGATYYFRLTAFDTSGNQSGFNVNASSQDVQVSTFVPSGSVAAPVITSALSATGVANHAFSYQITATNSPTSFNATGLPAGLSVNTGTGLISGTPSALGSSSISLSATNSGGTGTATLALSVFSACDTNRDGSTNVVDVQLDVNAALGVIACSSTYDMNLDGLCNVIDVQRVVNAALGQACVSP